MRTTLMLSLSKHEGLSSFDRLRMRAFTVAMNKRILTRADILPPEVYAKERAERRREAIRQKSRRQVLVGPHASFTFETWASMWLQVQEMLHIERGGEAQIADELSAYNPLIPNGRELVATVMIEIEDPERRSRVLAGLGGIERSAFLRVGGETIGGVPEADQERTDETGKASAVQFLHFPFTDAQVAKFRQAGTEVTLGFRHANYAHMTLLPEPVRAALAEDFA
jgi:Protein of unknown function (DUF3501)